MEEPGRHDVNQVIKMNVPVTGQRAMVHPASPCDDLKGQHCFCCVPAPNSQPWTPSWETPPKPTWGAQQHNWPGLFKISRWYKGQERLRNCSRLEETEDSGQREEQDGGAGRRGAHLPPQTHKNTLTCGTILTGNQLQTGRRFHIQLKLQKKIST